MYLITKKSRNVVFSADNQEELVRILNELLLSTNNFSLYEELNEMREQEGAVAFYDKNEIPIYFINLIIKDFNLEIKND
jgi:hypothetical protein